MVRQHGARDGRSPTVIARGFSLNTQAATRIGIADDTVLDDRFGAAHAEARAVAALDQRSPNEQAGGRVGDWTDLEIDAATGDAERGVADDAGVDGSRRARYEQTDFVVSFQERVLQRDRR